MRGPVIGFVRAQALEHFFDGVAFPRGADFGMKFQVALVGDAQERVQEAAVAHEHLGALTWRLPRFSNHGGSCRSMKTPVKRSR